MTTAKPFDLSNLETDDTATVEILHPATGEPIGATITVYGKDSGVYQKAQRVAEGKFTEYASRNRGKFPPPEDREKLDLNKEVAATKSIDGLSYKGEPLNDIREIFIRFPFIREQAQEARADRALFIKS